MGSSRTNQRGSAFMMVMLAMIPILVMVGMVVDVGWAYFTTESARTAAQAGAIAAARSAMDIVTAGGTYSCGSTGGSETMGCQSYTACASTNPTSYTSNLQNGCAYVLANGFTNGGWNGRQAVSIAANTTSPPPSVPGVQVSYWASVHITQQNPLSFLAVLGGKSLNVGVRATAGVINVSVPDCLVVLDPTANNALNISGSAQVHANGCNVEVDSSSSSSIDVSGGACLTANTITTHGGDKVTACTGSITTNASSFTNPLAGLSPPTFNTTHCDYTNYKVPSNGTVLYPGNYCGGITNSGFTASFSSGTYILIGGGLTSSSGSASLTGSGVTFYNTCNPSPCNSGSANYKPITISGGGSANLSAPTSGSLAGILFFQDPTVKTSAQDTFSGGSSVVLNGTLYFPNSQLVYSGGSGAASNTSIVADMVTFSGSSYLGSGTGGGGSSGPSTPTAALIE